MKKFLGALAVLLMAFVLSVQPAFAATFITGKAVVTDVHVTKTFYAKAGVIYLQNRNIADREYIDIRIELYKEDGTLVQDRVGNVYDFVSRQDNPYTVPEDGKYYFKLVNDTPGSHWYTHYKVTDHSNFWD
ncbi:hypothetical protein [Staphylospora marina]|uniref:hypothetical protein n=1 Tax=Staphylospora marina TaxID=2490858 RepID=UPI000F5BCD72|nr:hypothetical protein [Staphylospora marina]